MSCKIPCELELRSFHPKSLGIIKNSEQICRFGLYPMHYDSKNKVQKSIIRNSDLKEGKLSVWRTSAEDNSFNQIIEKNKKLIPIDQRIKEIFHPKAISIREISIDSFGKVICIVDDCKSDKVGSFDPEHCVIQPCRKCFGENYEHLDDICFRDIRNKLFVVFKQSRKEVSVNSVQK